MKEENLRLITNVRAVSELAAALRSYSVPRLGQWIGLGEVLTHLRAWAVSRLKMCRTRPPLNIRRPGGRSW